VYWVEGDWGVADALCNSTGAGNCSVTGEFVEKLSPDHIGPLSCGFKHTLAIQPVASKTNTTKNRRMKKQDVDKLIAYEFKTKEPPASWQVRSLWDKYKMRIHDDDQAVELSKAMRELQDIYLQTLKKLHKHGRAFLLRQLLHPEYALYDVAFVDLDPATLRFSRMKKKPRITANRLSLASRIVCIAFEELDAYTSKKKRRIGGRYKWCLEEADILIKEAQFMPLTDHDRKWNEATDLSRKRGDRKPEVKDLIVHPEKLDANNRVLLKKLRALFDKIGRCHDEKLERLIGFEIVEKIA
jgi:hypothetical protein